MDTTNHTTAVGIAENNLTPVLFNDVHFNCREEPVSPSTWAPFPRLPSELRLRIWLLSLRRHRMIELNLGPAAGDDDAPHYTDRNHLGLIVSGGNYAFHIRGCGSYAASPTPLLYVNHEARGAARSFYHIHLPLATGHILYLSSEYDVVYVRPSHPKPPPPTDPRPPPAFAAILVDFLHDARAYDYKNQGIGHLAMGSGYRQYMLDKFTDHVNLTPAILHPAAATSFADILRCKLRSLLCIVNFRCPTRGMGEFPPALRRFHFAQTFPLRRRGHPTGLFDWLPADPRPGVELDLRQLPINDHPESILRGWRELERGFGVTRNQQATQENDHGGVRLYICPAQRWPTQGMQRMNGIVRRNVEAEEAAEEVWSRDELAQHLQYEAEDWVEKRWFPARATGGTHPLPKYCSESRQEAEMFEAMEKLPCTAIGMWLFPAEAFPQPTNPQLLSFNMAAVRPGLFLFQVDNAC